MNSWKQLAEDIQGQWFGVEPKGEGWTAFTNDTRMMQEGSVFLALKGEKRDGHAFLAEALAEGASAAVVERVYNDVPIAQLKVDDVLAKFQLLGRVHRHRFQRPVVSVTGSCGKTSTKDLLTRLLGPEQVTSNYKNWNNTLGVPLTLTRMDLEKDQFGVIEAGINQQDEMSKLAWMIEPDIAVITNVAPVHLEFLGTIEQVAWHKSCLGRAAKEQGKVYFPWHCLRFEYFKDYNGKARVLCPMGLEVDDYPVEQQIFFEVQERESDLLLNLKLGKEERYGFYIPFMTDGMTQNAAISVAIALELGISPDQIQHQLANWRPSDLRGQIVHYNHKEYYVDCYNANPVSMLDAVKAFRRAFASRKEKMYVLGCMREMGEQARKFHYHVGYQFRPGNEDTVLIIGDERDALAQGIWDSGVRPKQVKCLASKEEARSIIDKFEGAVFVKGSLGYQLGDLVPKGGKQ